MQRLTQTLRALALSGVLLTSLDGLADPGQIAYGVSVGEVTSERAVIWSRFDHAAVMHAELRAQHSEQHADDALIHTSTPVTAAHDFTGKLLIDGLQADTTYHYRLWFSTDNKHAQTSKPLTGQFVTAPRAMQAKNLHFAWGGDVAGQNVCRDTREGFPAFSALNALELDFFIGLGDMIYADGLCTATGLYGNAQVPGDFNQSATLRDYWAHWKYNRADAAQRRLLAKVPYYAVWDDHEVANDFGPLQDTRNAPPYTPGQHLLPIGLAAFLDYNPIAQSGATPGRLYRNIRWGKNLELFMLDTREYRDANQAEDSAERAKTLLGREQLTWLKTKLAASNATWKIIVSSVPMSIPTGYPSSNGRDGWANDDQQTGFEQELINLLSFMRDHKENNVMFITTDVHFSEVFAYTPFADTPDFQVHEFVSGPMNAGLFPTRAFDTTLGTESLFFYGPDKASDVKTWEQAKHWFNFGQISIDEDGALTAQISTVTGKAVYKQRFVPR